jgi:hypothetical protein
MLVQFPGERKGMHRARYLPMLVSSAASTAARFLPVVSPITNAKVYLHGSTETQGVPEPRRGGP